MTVDPIPRGETETVEVGYPPVWQMALAGLVAAAIALPFALLLFGVCR